MNTNKKILPLSELNHPSGDPEPSKEDGEVTRKVAAAAKLIDCDLLDHIVIGDGVFVSFKERGAV